ncbi:MAG: DNA mismatch repair endonuclease MutL [Solirubrobacterales bacterium]
MKRINVLDTNTANKIAAGEVVERPFSVVKELVENSVDSNATSITVEVYEGGEKLIKVIDNGSGIFPEDLEKAFLPHATSKIKAIDDIFKIDTLGFRGEALASIASVAKVSMKSRTIEFDFGKDIYVSAGEIEYIKDTGTNIGTTVEVRDIFFNVPARKKFLKSQSREYAYISDILTRIALANPSISFKLINNDKVVFSTFGTGEVIDVIRALYGKNVCENVIKFEEHRDVISVYGYIGNADTARGNRNHQSIFVNKRYIKNKTIGVAVENAFKSFCTVNKYPFFVLFIDIYPEFIDVNVHPTKSEIKFKDEREVFSIVFNAVHSALRQSLRDTFTVEEEENIENPEYKTPEIKAPETKVEFTYQPPKVQIQLPIDLKQKEVVIEQKEEYKPLKKEAKLPDIRIIGQFSKTYIIGEYRDELYLIDQHAAHEKILFEKYMEEIRNQEVVSQVLITPVVIELNNEDNIIYQENMDLFRTIGFNIEEFGQNTICIREVPLILGKPNVKELFYEIIENLRGLGSGEKTEIKYNSIAKKSCRAAVKANDNLSEIEMKSLLHELKYIEDPYNCPHGRPTIIKLSLNELEKRFKRIQ